MEESKSSRKQLKILQDEQASRQAQLARKPKLELYISLILLRPVGILPAKARQSTDDRSVYDVALKNSGDATATKGTLRATVSQKDAWFESSSGVSRVYEEPDSQVHTFLIPFEFLRTNVQIPMSFAIGYPKGQQLAVMVNFSVDAEEIPSGTPLGVLVVVPPQKPVN